MPSLACSIVRKYEYPQEGGCTQSSGLRRRAPIWWLVRAGGESLCLKEIRYVDIYDGRRLQTFHEGVTDDLSFAEHIRQGWSRVTSCIYYITTDAWQTDLQGHAKGLNGTLVPPHTPLNRAPNLKALLTPISILSHASNTGATGRSLYARVKLLIDY